MKPFAFFLVWLALHARAAELALTDVSPHLPVEAQIIWKAPTKGLPKTLWTYEKRPAEFSRATIVKALLIAAFDLKPLPKTFTERIVIWDKQVEGDMQPDYFSIEPNLGFVTFRRQRYLVAKGDTEQAALLARTWRYSSDLFLDKAELAPGPLTDNSASLSRRVDGVPFLDETEGLFIRYGNQGEIRMFSLNWPKLERTMEERMASPQEIIRCIRAFKTPVVPANDEPDYLGRVKTFAAIQSLTITNLTIYYSEGRFGEQPDEKRPETHVTPIVILDGTAQWKNSNALVRLFAPFSVRDITRLLLQNHAEKPRQ